MRLNVPSLGQAELEAIAAVLDSGYLTQGQRAAEFEDLVSRYVGTRFGFATSSATTGLHLALHAAGVRAGDEVVVPDFSFPATANAVIQQGAVPVFVDIDLDTFNIEPTLLDAAITSRTRAIMPVHAFGLCADMSAINRLASSHGIPVIEDAACALGSEFEGARAGSLGDIGVFSFHPRKIITTGEGGVITTDNEEIAEQIKVLRAHGAVRGELFMEFVDAGYNYRLSDVHAAIGVAQMARLANITESRQRLARELTERLSTIEGVQTPSAPKGRLHSYQSYVVLLEREFDRDKVIQAMRSRGIETTLGTYAMHLQPYFRDRFSIPDSALLHATEAHYSSLTLPLHPQLNGSDLDRIAESLSESLAESRDSRPVRG